MMETETITFKEPFDLIEKVWGKVIMGGDAPSPSGTMSFAAVEDKNSDKIKLITMMPTDNSYPKGPYATFNHIGEADQYTTHINKIAYTVDSGIKLFEELNQVLTAEDIVKSVRANKELMSLNGLRAYIQRSSMMATLWGCALYYHDWEENCKALGLSAMDLRIFGHAWLNDACLEDDELVRKLVAVSTGKNTTEGIGRMQVAAFRRKWKRKAKRQGPCCKSCEERKASGNI
jgi:hypothetical protein